MATKTQNVDITPTPRILRTLGDIPFDAWQCLAELIDNSVDAFREAENRATPTPHPRIDVIWSREDTPSTSREVIVEDNGPGMPLEVLQSAAKAGYSSNDPIHTLGLFGMGFNIATARLGDETLFLSATADGEEWVGIRINFEELIRDQVFSAPVVRVPKETSSESGTKIIVRGLKEGVFQDLKKKEGSIRRRLETIYTTILDEKKVEIRLQGNLLSPRPHCVWSGTRYIVRKGAKIMAVQPIDRDLGETYFDIFKNSYLSNDEAAELDIELSQGEELPENVVRRSRRLKGWVGIQRYSDTSDFGIDFIRNGRKILAADKSLFGYENPETGNVVQEYPVELGTTVGGRIVGELHVDYLIPTYQKNGFDTTDKAWRLTVDAIRGAGPILPKRRSDLGYDGNNDSPLGLLVNAYRRTDPGTKNLAIPKALAKEFADEFRRGNPNFETDDKWFRAAQEADRERGEGGGRSTPVNTGGTPSDDPDDYGPPDSGAPEQTSEEPQNVVPDNGETLSPTSTNRDHLMQNSNKVESLSGKYAHDTTLGMKIIAWRVNDEHIKIDGERVPYCVFQDGVEVDFFFDPTHQIISEYPISPKQLLLQSLAEKFSIRDRVTAQKAFIGLVNNHLGDERINYQALQDRAQSIMNVVRETLPQFLAHRVKSAFEVLKEVPSEEEELGKKLIDEAPQLLEGYQSQTEESAQVLFHVPDATVIRLVEAFPEEFLDGKLFEVLYLKINIGQKDTTERLKKISLDKVVSYLKDVALLLKGGQAQSKHELVRHSNTLALLESLLIS